MKNWKPKLQKFLIGESRPIRKLPLQDKRYFYDSLGVTPIAIYVMLLILVILANTTFVHGGWTRMIVFQSGTIVALVVVKCLIPPYRTSCKQSERSVDVAYEIREDFLIIEYEGSRFKCDDYILSPDGELEDCLFIIENADSETESREKVLRYLDDRNEFIECTTYRKLEDVAIGYKVVSWCLYFTSVLLSIYWVVKFIAIILN